MQTIKHSDDIEATIETELGLVTLRLRHFDSQAVADFVTEVLPQHGAVAYQDGDQAPNFQLAIFLGGQRHTAHVVRLADGRTTVLLDCPFEEHKRQLHKAAARALQLLHEAGWQAIVIGDVPSGTITWDSLAEVRFDDRERAMSTEESGKLWDRLQAEAPYAVFVERASIYQPGTFEQMLRGPHLAWDPASGSVATYKGGRGKVSADSKAQVFDDGALRRGTVSRLNQGAGFGYVDDDDGVHCYIFVFGHAIKHSDARQLSVGARVRFRLEERGRVSGLQLA